MALTKTKLKSNIKEELESEEQGKKGSGSKDDPRFLPYWNLEERETIKVIFIPDEDGELWKSYRKHGSGIKVSGVGSINCCYHSNGESCPACQLSWDAYQEGNEAENERWKWKETLIAQCIPVESDIEIPEDEESDNLVKLIYLPFKVKEKIREAMVSGEIDDPSDYVFVLKKNKSPGGYNTYENSYFLHKPLEDVVPKELFEAAEEGVIQPYRLADEMPEPTTEDEVQEWVDKAQKKINKGQNAKSGAQGVRDTIQKSNSNDSDNGDSDNMDHVEGKTEGDTTDASEGTEGGGDASSRLRNRLRSGRK